MGMFAGVTTNPTLIAREDREIEPLIMEIGEIVAGPARAEVVGTAAEGMIAEAANSANIHDNIVEMQPVQGPNDGSKRQTW